MVKDERILRVIFDSVDEVNEYLPKQDKIGKSLETALIDESSRIDSLALVSLITTIEQKVEEEYAVAINLADESGLSGPDNPFKSFATLAERISLLVGGKEQ